MIRVLFFISMIFFVCCDQSGVSSKNIEKLNKLNYLSQSLIFNNKLDSAKLVIQQALKLDSEDYVAYNNRALVKIKEGLPEKEILADYRRCLQLNPNYDIAIYSLANYYFIIADYQDCLTAATKYLELLSYSTEDKKGKYNMYFIRGKARKFLLEFNDAITDFTTYLEFDSTDAECYKDIGDCLYFSKYLDSAISEYSKAIQFDTSYFEAYLGRAMAYESYKIPSLSDSAILDYKKAFIISPDATDIYGTNSVLFFKEKEFIKRMIQEKLE